MKTFGALSYLEVVDATAGTRSHGQWLVNCEPHVMVKIRRLFPRAYQGRGGSVGLRDTPEIARDLEWLLTRWPMDLDAVTRERLTQRADEHRGIEQMVQSILEGHVPPADWREPARPARDYQSIAAGIVHATGRLLLLDDLGLGKTMTSLLTLRDPQALPALVVTLTHLPSQWLEQLQLTLPWLDGHIVRTGTPYDPTRKRGVKRQPDVLICNYAKMPGWSAHLAGEVRTVIFDEVQELRHAGTRRYEAAEQLARAATYRWGLSATPVFNYGGEMYNIVNLLAPDVLGSREEFTREWGGDGRNGGTDPVQPRVATGHIIVKDPKALGTYLRDQGLVLRRTRADVGRELPPVVPIVHTIDLDETELHAAIARDDLASFAKIIVASDVSPTMKWQASGELDWRMRQATGIAKAPYVAQFVRMLLESEQKVVLAGWHRAVYEVWLDHLAAYQPMLYTGSESPAGKARAKDAFLNGDCRVLVMSLRTGAGLDGLQAASNVVVFGELDWSPGPHEQLIGRLQRDGQNNNVFAYYLVSEYGSDPIVVDVNGVKRRQSEPMLDPDAPLAVAAVDTTDRIRRLAESVLTRHSSPGAS